MNWILKTFDELSVHELYAVLQLRSKVFVVEQNCAYQDMDDTDKLSLHLFLLENGKAMACARLMPPGISYEQAGIGRVVVDPEKRGTETGKALVREATKQVKEKFKTENITISAQLYLLKFYKGLGFNEVGETYLEDNIPHIKMKM
jgi:ElaA protein